MNFNSIRSGGGPLLCIERALEQKWLGVTGRSALRQSSNGNVTDNDYQRACQVRDYLGAIEVKGCEAFVLGDMPLETFIWEREGELPSVVRVFYGDSGVDVVRALELARHLDFSLPIEALNIRVHSSPLSIFDAAYPGFDEAVEKLELNIPPGRYTVVSKQFDLDDRTSVLIHKFEQAH